MIRHKGWLFIITILLFCNPVFAQRQGIFVNPADTDNQINTNLEPHYVAINRSVRPRNQLFLFFPGTGATPTFYQLISNRAADLGFHVINLNYPNDKAVNQLCGAGTDLDCYGNVRLEILDGKDRSNLVQVSQANSIENRLIKLLVFLSKQFPNDGWEQFLNSNGINWQAIVVSGHSQGGGMAGIIGRYHPVARSVMFSASDYNERLQKLANWIANPTSTPNASSPDKFWAFQHEQDELVPFNINSTKTWPAYGMPAFGPIINVDSNISPYQNTHSLTTNLTVSGTGSSVYHGCVVVDLRVPKLSNGTPVYQVVWDYLLSNTIDTVTPTVKVLSPNGGEIVQSGSNLTINFNSTDNVGVVSQDINLSIDGGKTFPISVVSGLAGNANTFNFPVPSDLETNTARVQVIAKDMAGNMGMANSSNDFFIVKNMVKDTEPPTITISSPSAGASFNGGSMVTVTFSSKDNVGVISQNVLLSTDGTNFTSLASGLAPSQTSFSFQLPTINSFNAAIKVEALDQAGNKGSATVGQLKVVSDTEAPKVTINSPTANQKLLGGKPFNVTFTSTDNVGVVSQEVQIALNGNNFTTLASGLSGNATSATVTIPNTKAKAAVIRVVAKDAAGNVGMANSSSFKIKVSK